MYFFFFFHVGIETVDRNWWKFTKKVRTGTNLFIFLFSASGGGGSMLVPPVAQSGTPDRPVGDTGARAQQTSGPAAAATLWPLAPAQSNQIPNQQSQGIPPLAATPAPAHSQGMYTRVQCNRYTLLR